MKPYRHVSVIAFFALCSQAFALGIGNDNPSSSSSQSQGQSQGQQQNQAVSQGQQQAAVANPVAVAMSAYVGGLAAQAYSPDMVTTANCIIGASAGGAGLGWGFSIGSGIEDKGCTRRENARLLKNLGKGDAAIKIMCNDPEVAAALGEANCPAK